MFAGGLALDPQYFNTTNSTAKAMAWHVHSAAKEVGKQIVSMQPDLIVLSTPHGIAAAEDFMFYLSPKGSGFADTDNCACPPCCYKLNVTMDTASTKKLVANLKFQLNRVSYLSAFGTPGQEDVPFPLQWGEVVPLIFAKAAMNKTKVAIVSQPSRRYSESVAMIPELQQLGQHLQEALTQLPFKTIIIISADLAHTHDKSGPYGFSKAAQPFDEACGQWVTTLNSDKLLVTASGYVDKALSCGYTGLVMLDGLLKSSGMLWKSQLHVNLHPSYYGMMVASFLPYQ